MKLAILGTTEAIDMENETPAPSAFLLALLKESYRVIVVSSKKQPSRWDAGWLPLIPSEDVYFLGRLPLDPFAASSEEYKDPYRVLFDKLGLKHPPEASDWIDYKNYAMDQGVVSHYCQLLAARVIEACKHRGHEKILIDDPTAHHKEIEAWVRSRYALALLTDDGELAELLSTYAVERRIKLSIPVR